MAAFGRLATGLWGCETAMSDIPSELPRNPLLRWGAYGLAVSAILAAGTGVYALTGSDAPPLANISRVEKVQADDDAAHERINKRADSMLTVLNAESVTVLQIQLRACQKDRLTASADVRSSPHSDIAQESLDEAKDCIRALSRQINKSPDGN
jgi:hypothetical protein